MATERDSSTTTAGLGRYEIDPDASTVAFRCRAVFGLVPVRGTFTVRSGTVDVAEPLADSRIRAEIDTASFDTGNRRRDDHVRSADYLDAARHPLMTFVADQVGASAVAGTLTVCGVSRPVRLAVTRADATADALSVRATTRVDRTAFGVTTARGMTGRWLDVTLDIRCARR
jgi:polyisoprenoid-binding protein YceI